MSKREKNEISEPHYEVLCQMTRHIVGLYFPYSPQDFEERFWVQAKSWQNAYDLPFARLSSMSERGLILRRDVATDFEYPKVQYAIPFETFSAVRQDLIERMSTQILADAMLKARDAK